MKWVLGTGRCGMQNYTTWKNGYIESNQPIRALSVKKFQVGLTDEEEDYVTDFFKARAELNVPSVADCCQYMFIDTICDVDQNAEFVWLIRKREDCIRSFMDKHSEEQRIHPIDWVFSNETKPKLMEWFYDTVNGIIFGGLMGKRFEKIKTESMPLLVSL